MRRRRRRRSCGRAWARAFLALEAKTRFRRDGVTFCLYVGLERVQMLLPHEHELHPRRHDRVDADSIVLALIVGGEVLCRVHEPLPQACDVELQRANVWLRRVQAVCDAL